MTDAHRNSGRSERKAAMRERIARYSHILITKEAWFQKANELVEAMSLLEPRVEHHWQCLRKQLDDPNAETEPEYNLMNVHMLLAGFAIENFCKGHLVDQLGPDEWENVKGGVLPESLKGNHGILKFVEETGMRLSESEKYLLKRIGEAVLWRGRYPVPTSHEKTGPFAQIGSDVRRIRTLLDRLRRHVGAKEAYRT
jgi:hypothetical protein